MTAPGRILIIKLGAIGDVVNTLPLLRRMRAGWPDSSITWLIEPPARAVIEGDPDVDDIIVFDRSRWARSLGPTLSRLRRGRFDLALDLQRTAKSGLFAFLSGAARTIGFDRARCRELSFLFVQGQIPPGSDDRHVIEQYLEFADALGLPAGGPDLRLHLGDAAATRAGELLEKGSRPIAINPGATKPANRWPPERFGELAARLAAAGYGPLLITGAGSYDRAAADAIKHAAGDTPIRSLVDTTSIQEIAAIYARCRLVITGDSGPLHLAVAAGAPVIAIFGPANASRTGPWNATEGVVRTGIDCSPCRKRICPLYPEPRCLTELPVDQVFQAVTGRLAAPGPS